ncbi:MAG: capsule assembly Wzi family protein [Cyclobacteriaceae bacterium]|nr:capsule assembly Wzi family protein [Cyclobacteriaceae bacterium]
MMKLIKRPSWLLFLAVCSGHVYAEPFIKTDDRWLRADIELLANIGVLKTPVTTFPLTWGPILKELSETKLNDVPEQYHATYLRVLRIGRNETSRDNYYSEVDLRAAQESQLFRAFGDSARSEREVSTRTTGMSNNFAWNIQVTIAPQSIDGDDKRFDGSYFAGIAGNWIFSMGQIEKWWGPGNQHSIILSNNAKPMPGLMFQRNYSEPFETPLLSWMGPWTTTSFIGLLDDARTIDQAKLIGISYSFMPLDSLEVGLRRTAQWGGEGRPENFDSFIDLLIGIDNCDEGSLNCANRVSEPGNQLAGIDLTWRPQWAIPTSFYLQTVGEDEAGFAPAKKAWLFGSNIQLVINDNIASFNVEYIDTSVDGDGNDPNEPFSGFNVLYEHSIYRHGYRYLGRSIGSSLDNDSKALVLDFIYQTTESGSFNVTFRDIALNEDGEDKSEPGGHSISSAQVEFREVSFKWLYTTNGFGEFEFSYINRDKNFISNFGDIQKSSFGINWTKKF